MFNKICYFLRYLLNKFRKPKSPSHVILMNHLPEDKKKYVTGTRSLCYCRGHDCIIANFFLTDFMKQIGDYIGKIIGLTINIKWDVYAMEL